MSEFLVTFADKPDVQSAKDLLPGQAMVFLFFDEHGRPSGEMKVEALMPSFDEPLYCDRCGKLCDEEDIAADDGRAWCRRCRAEVVVGLSAPAQSTQ